MALKKQPTPTTPQTEPRLAKTEPAPALPATYPLGTKLYQRYQYGTAVEEVTVIGVLYHITRGGVKVTYELDGHTPRRTTEVFETPAQAFASFATTRR
jgi:hypothetical protein